MILLYGAIASILTQGIKYASKKLGKEVAGAYILVAVFILCLGFGVLEYFANLSKWASWEVLVGGAVSAVGIYELFTRLIWKQVKR